MDYPKVDDPKVDDPKMNDPKVNDPENRTILKLYDSSKLDVHF